MSLFVLRTRGGWSANWFDQRKVSVNMLVCKCVGANVCSPVRHSSVTPLGFTVFFVLVVLG